MGAGRFGLNGTVAVTTINDADLKTKQNKKKQLLVITLQKAGYGTVSLYLTLTAEGQAARRAGHFHLRFLSEPFG